MKMTASEVK